MIFITFQKLNACQYITNFEKRLKEPPLDSNSPQVIKINNITYCPLLSHKQEKELVIYLRQQKGLTKKDICHILCSFCSCRGIKLPHEWETENLDAMGWVKSFIIRNELSPLLHDCSENAVQERKENPEVKKENGIVMHIAWYVCADGSVCSSETVSESISLDHAYALKPPRSTSQNWKEVRLGRLVATFLRVKYLWFSYM